MDELQSHFTPLSQETWDELKSKESNFLRFFENIKHRIAETDDFDSLLDELQSRAFQVKSAISEFRHFIEELPLAIALAYWIKGEVTDIDQGVEKISALNKLIDQGIIPLKNQEGAPLILCDLRWMGHRNIINEIRCVKEWGTLEKEKLVSVYLQFSQHLGQMTFGFIPHDFDPDRRSVAHKTVRYEVFIEFVQHLSPRDALIAKLLYFGASSAADVLSLQVNQIDFANHKVSYPNQSVVYPKHLMLDLQEHTQGKKGEELVFVNTRGSKIERAHLSHSFERALSKADIKERFTPGQLLETSRK